MQYNFDDEIILVDEIITELIEDAKSVGGIISYEKIFKYCDEYCLTEGEFNEVINQLESNRIIFNEYENDVLHSKYYEPEEEIIKKLKAILDTNIEDSVRYYVREIKEIEPLNNIEENNLAKQILNGTEEEITKAKERLLKANLYLVFEIAIGYINRGLEFADLIQEGNLGLIKAVDCYNYSRNHTFEIYAAWWIRQSITRAIASQGRTISIPMHISYAIERQNRAVRCLYKKLGREPSIEEIAEFLGITENRVREIIEIAQDPVSLENLVKEENQTNDENSKDKEELGVSSDSTLPEKEMERKILKEQIFKLLDMLTEREKKVLTLLYGLTDGIQKSHIEVGKEFGVTGERIHQIEAKAIRKIRSNPNMAKLWEDFEED